jgi:hypothetical protein
MKELKVGCGKPTGSAVGDAGEVSAPAQGSERKEEQGMSMARVGQKAPDFEAPAYRDGKFGQIKLSDYVGKWICLCFYPGDFTFV